MFLAVGLWMLCIAAHAADRTWLGLGGNGLWSNPNNWTPTGVPVNGETLRFPPVPPIFGTTAMDNDLVGLRPGTMVFGGTAGEVTYSLSGNALYLSDYVLIGVVQFESETATVTLNCPLILEGGTRFQVSYGSDGLFSGDANHLRLNSAINLNGQDLSISLLRNSNERNARVDIAGAISGTGNVSLSAQDTCSIWFNGAADNTFNGTLTYYGETSSDLLALNKTGGAVTYGRFVLGGRCRWYGPNQIGDDATLELDDELGVRSARALMNGFNEVIDTLEFIEHYRAEPQYNTQIDTQGGTLTVLDTIRATAQSGDGYASIVGKLDVPTAMICEVNGSEFVGLDIQAVISGGGSINKSGSQTLLLSGNNTFSGYINVYQGLVEPAHVNAFGSTARGIQLNGGGVRLNSFSIQGEPLSCNTGGSVLSAFGTCTWGGPIALADQLLVYGENLTLSRSISGSGGLFILGTVVTLAGTENNTFTGPLQPRCEVLQLNKSSGYRAFSGPLIVGPSAAPKHEVRWLNSYQLPENAEVTLYTNALLSLPNAAEAVSNLTFTGGRVTLGADAALQLLGTLKVNPTNMTAVIEGATGLGSLFLPSVRTFEVNMAGLIADLEGQAPHLHISARIAGGGFTKTGSGYLHLSGNNIFAGPVVIEEGVVLARHNNALGGVNGGTTVKALATLGLGVETSLVREPLTLTGRGVGDFYGALATLGEVTLSNNIVIVTGATIRADAARRSPETGLLRIEGTISGDGWLQKDGQGALVLAGAANNTYTGDTFVTFGTLALDKPDFAQAVPGNLIIGGDDNPLSSPVVQHRSHDQIWANVTVNGDGVLDLNGYEEYLLALTLNDGGDVHTGAGLLTLEGNLAGDSLTVNPGSRSSSSLISGRLGLRTGNHRFAVGSSLFGWLLGSPELDITAAIINYNGIANLHKNGSGAMRLAGANTFTGTLNVNGGVVIAAHNSAFGTTQGSTTVQSNGVVALDGNIAINEFLLLDTTAPAALQSLSGTNLSTGAINLLRPSCGIDVPFPDGRLQLLGRIGSSGGLTKLGAGTLEFFGPGTNDYAGLTVISNGVVEARRGNGLGLGWTSIPGDIVMGDDSSGTTSARLRVQLAGQLNRRATATLRRTASMEFSGGRPGANATLRRLLGAGTVNLAVGSFLIISNDVSFTFDGSLAGGGSLGKFGQDTTMHFTGNGTLTGPTTISEGKYLLDGAMPSSPVTIRNQAALLGDGETGPLTVESAGVVKPESAQPGRLAADLAASSLDLQTGGVLSLDFFGAHGTAGNDVLTVAGSVALNSSRLSAGFLGAPREGEVVMLIRKTSAGPVTGTFSGWSQGAVQKLGEIPVAISYSGGDGNDVTLTVTNLAAGASGVQVLSGNGNGLFEPDECNLVFLGVQNRRNFGIKPENVSLRSLTPTALVTISTAEYPNIPASSIRSNLAPFQVRTLASHPCGAPVLVELQATVAGEGTFVIPFTLLGGTDCGNGGGACESCTVVSGTFATNSPLWLQPLLAAGEASICFPEKPCPGVDLNTNLPPVRYVQHRFTNTTDDELCVTAQLHFDCPTAPVGALHAAAFLGVGVSSSPCVNYLGDSGVATPSAYAPFSFRVPSGSNFVVVVSTRAADIGCDSYWVELFGLPCPPPRLDIARDVTPGNVLLQWSTAYPEWRLQSVGDLGGKTMFVDGPEARSAAVSGGRFTVTNRTAFPAQFHRLSR
jgi:autotransporter-associated beta strand protein